MLIGMQVGRCCRPISDCLDPDLLLYIDRDNNDDIVAFLSSPCTRDFDMWLYAAGVAGVRIPQYLTCRGPSVCWTPVTPIQSRVQSHHFRQRIVRLMPTKKSIAVHAVTCSRDITRHQ